METIFECAKVPTDMCDKPRIPVTIFDCGEIESNNKKLEEEDLFGSISNLNKEQKQQLEKLKQLEQEDLKKAEEEEKLKGIVEVDEELEQDDQNLQFKDEKAKRLHELKLKMNQARKLNNQAVIEENERINNPSFDRNRKRKEWQEQQNDISGILDKKGVAKDKHYLTDTAAKANKLKKRDKKKNTFSWDVFNDDTIYRAYDKRTEKLNKDEIEESNLNDEDKKKLEQERVDRLVEDLEQQNSKRSQFSRKRMHIEEHNVDYINERNRKFNKKLERNFGKYAAEYKANLSWGTGL